MAKHFMNREFVKRNVVAALPRQPSDAELDTAVDDAVRLLCNLVHYQNERSHYDEDIAYAARVLLARSGVTA